MDIQTIVIVGGGAGGLELATRLGNSLGRRGKAEIILVDATMTHLWKPRLHEVAAGAINANLDELNYVAHAKNHGFRFVLGRMCNLDRLTKQIQLEVYEVNGKEVLAPRSIKYDKLVIAVGSQTNDFGTKGASDHCVFLDKRDSAEKFHSLFIDTYLAASNDESKRHCRVSIIGAGATGVELAAELVHSAKELISYGFDGIKPDDLKVSIIEASDRVLPALSEKSSAAILRQLKKIGIEVLTEEMVTEVTDKGLHTKSGHFIEGDLQVWSAGVKAPAFLGSLGLESNRINQLVVKPTLQCVDDDSIFAFGDCAQCSIAGTKMFVPPRAQSASQQATLLEKNLKRSITSKELLDFKYKDKGSLISLSKHNSVGQIMGNLSKDFTFEGKVARWLYISLYRMHQLVLHGYLHTALLVVRDRLNRRTGPKLKLH